MLFSYIQNQNIRVENKLEFQKAETIDFSDSLLEIVPEVYLDEKEPTKTDILLKIDKKLRETISSIITGKYENNFFKNAIDPTFFNKGITPPNANVKLKEIPITALFKDPINTGDYHSSSAMDEGTVPLISTSSTENGLEKYVEITGNITTVNAITIACDGSPLSCFYQYYPFVAKDNVLVCIPNATYRFTTIVFILSQIEGLKWRFSYGRKSYKNKINKLKIFMPFTNDLLDEDYMEYFVKQLPAWKLLINIFKDGTVKSPVGLSDKELAEKYEAGAFNLGEAATYMLSEPSPSAILKSKKEKS